MTGTARLLAACGAWLLLAACKADAPQATAEATASAPAGAASASALSSAAASATATRSNNETRARQLAKRFIIIDGHVDLPHRLHGAKEADGDRELAVAKGTEDGDFDYPRAKKGGLDAPFMSIYIPAKHQKEGGAKALADELIDMVEAIVSKSPDKFALVRSVDDVQKNFDAGKISLPLGIENGAALEGSLQNVKHFHSRGVRYITLTHSKDNDICDSSYDESRTHKGLSAFGRQVVAEMNRVGIMVDISHVSDQAFEQAVELSQVPVIASHSSCRRYTPDFERNMSDAMIKKLAGKGGVIMINFGSSFIDDRARQVRSKLWKDLSTYTKQEKITFLDPKAKKFAKNWAVEHNPPFATVEQVADHIDHAVKIGGIDHVGLGSDFDGVGDSLPTGLKDASELPNLIRVLLARGYSEPDIEKICSGNASQADDKESSSREFPAELFERLGQFGVGSEGQRVLELCAATGHMARSFARRGCKVTGIDKSSERVEQLRQRHADDDLGVQYSATSAERTGFEAASFDVVAAGQCWQWLNRPKAAREVKRVLRPAGALVIAHFDWLPLPENAVEATETVIEKYRSEWEWSGRSGLYPSWLRDVRAVGFVGVETFSFDVPLRFTHEAWRARVCGNRGVNVSLRSDELARFDENLRVALAERFPEEQLVIPFRVWAVVCRTPAA
jgi:membrane dipeptidase